LCENEIIIIIIIPTEILRVARGATGFRGTQFQYLQTTLSFYTVLASNLASQHTVQQREKPTSNFCHETDYNNKEFSFFSSDIFPISIRVN